MEFRDDREPTQQSEHGHNATTGPDLLTRLREMPGGPA